MKEKFLEKYVLIFIYFPQFKKIIETIFVKGLINFFREKLFFDPTYKISISRSQTNIDNNKRSFVVVWQGKKREKRSKKTSLLK